MMQKAVYESQQKSARANDDDDDEDAEDDDRSDDGDEEVDGVEEDEEYDDEEDDEDVSSDDDDDDDDVRKRKRHQSRKTSPKKQSSKKLSSEKSLSLTPPRSKEGALKSPTVASPSAVSALLRPRADKSRIANSAQIMAERFTRGGNENLKTSSSQSLKIGDLLVIVDADFSSANRRHVFTEVALFASYCVYFYKINSIGTNSITIQYAGRNEPLDSNPSVEFNTPLQLDQLPRDSLTLPTDPKGHWVIASTKGKPLLKALFPKTIDDKNSDDKNSGGGGGGGFSRGSSGRSSSSSSRSSSYHTLGSYYEDCIYTLMY
jgi:hypothetical protein